MEHRLDSHLDKQDEVEWSYCPLCNRPMPRDQMGRFNCKECEEYLDGQELAVEEYLRHFEQALQEVKEGRNDRRARELQRDTTDTRSPSIAQYPLFE